MATQQLQPHTPGENPRFTIALENGGVIRGELYPQYAPQTVGNFIALANSHFYDGMCFCRVIRDYLIQAGRAETPLPYCIRGEFEFNSYRQKALAHEYGSLGMSRGAGYDSASSEFYVALTDNPRELACLDGAYAVFGRVTEGLDLAEAISLCDTGLADEPMKRQGIASVRVETFGQQYPFQKLEPCSGAVTVSRAVHRGRRPAALVN